MAVKLAFYFFGSRGSYRNARGDFADVGVALIAIFNSMRILKKIKQKNNKKDICTLK